MSSRDRSDRNRESGRTASDGSGNAHPDRPDPNWEFDPAEINRYLSGGPSRSRGTTRPSSEEQPPAAPGRRTADSLEQLRRTRQQVQQSSQPAGNAPRPRPAQSRLSNRGATPPTRDVAFPPPTESSQQTTVDETGATRLRQRPAAQGEPREEITGYQVTPDWDDTALVDESEESAAPEAMTARVPRPRLTRPQLTVARPAELPRPAVPAFIKGADLANDATALALIGIALLSLAVMAILVANRIGGVASPFATHVNASGALEHFEKNSAIWRMPLLSAMFFLMNLVAAWFISPTDRFLSRFLLGVSAVVQLVVWIALIHFLW